ncbi:MAG: peptidylprolyl isomerase [Acholeplasmataceae bacterium]|nr:peptidylprolyl isomerase [Acholeplasmataceae bacterium]
MNYQIFRDEKNPVVTLKVKNYGTITIELFPRVAPNTVNNFIHHIQNNYYEGLIFHRIIPGFMIQGGGGSSVKPIRGEFTLNGFENPLMHTRGVISMARTSNPNSQTTQFFIMHQNAPHLDRQYASFGVVTSGIEVVDSIAAAKRDVSDRPYEDIIIESMTVDLKGQTYDAPIFL